MEVSVKTLSVVAITGLMGLGNIGFAQAQVSGTPYSPFPDAAPHEIRIYNGIPCRTILDRASGVRLPVQCAGPDGVIGVDPTATGNVFAPPPYGVPGLGAPPYAFPERAQSDIQIINGFKCRTEFIEETGEHLPVECVR
ncbi:hypothetical protein [Microvirga lotononidis]|uniref:Uncharacterized protein n=1 Tax=Microvirga lotononidis TaxID=864069 RepID=I4YUA6_9HYPH|nr:hypothetical protein [Microvirga lotononidis]EIM27548.1 hypothetical protein MicloDRAFT_00041160 [Microvirga lotononidis]WQO28303.1 hypothetical protein U0023_04145 [Microvirga lotononidis]